MIYCSRARYSCLDARAVARCGLFTVARLIVDFVDYVDLILRLPVYADCARYAFVVVTVQLLLLPRYALFVVTLLLLGYVYV